MLFEKESEFRLKVLPIAKHNKNTDLRIDNNYWEVELPSFPYSFKRIDQRLRKVAHQADHVILFFKKSFSLKTVQTVADGKLKSTINLKSVLVIMNNEVVLYLKK
ncbi:MAG: Contact-dependent growth inhibition CdiA C-terminal domain [Bacteroidota bacterium]|jgi:hypothetical protein